jgi:hypothetical protein
MSREVNYHIKELIRKEIQEALTESKMQIGQGNYSVHTLIDRKGLAISFIPDSKTLDIPVNTQVNDINALLKKKLGALGDAFYFESGHDAAGRVYRLNTDSFTNVITKLLTK